MLDMMQIDEREVVVQRENISIEDLLRETALMMQATAEKRDITIQYTVKGRKELSVVSDHTMLKNILDCLLANAIEYSYAKNAVYLEAEEKEGVVVFSVRDSGIAIPQDEQKHIFERFFRASNAKKVKTEGTGLGLAIASKLTEKINGRIWFESKEGKGTVFYLEVPKYTQKQ
jgi:signal transduction histidine kinase